jgi:hypothetical protein
MASKLLPDNPLTKRAQKWKKDQGIISLTLEEMKKKIKDKEFIAEQKVDGQSAIMEYADGKAKFGSLGGRIITDIPVLTEIEVILKKQDVKHALMVGELAGVENGKIIYFDKTESLIKNPAGEKDALHWFPYQLLEINGEKYGEEFETYKKSWPQIVKLFAGAKHITPVKYNTNSLDAAWKQYVEKEGNEGIVVRTSENKVYKCKPEFFYDLVIVAVGDKKGKNWPKKMIGTTLMAFMDHDKIFRVAGEIGSGYTDAEAKELFSWAQKNKVGEDNTHIWVKPERVVELQWERSNVRLGKAYKFERGEYIRVEDRLVGTIVKPRFLRYRTDKSVNPDDLRLTQIPGWEQKSRELSKKARRIASQFLNLSTQKETWRTFFSEPVQNKFFKKQDTVDDIIMMVCKKRGDNGKKIIETLDSIEDLKPSKNYLAGENGFSYWLRSAMLEGIIDRSEALEIGSIYSEYEREIKKKKEQEEENRKFKEMLKEDLPENEKTANLKTDLSKIPETKKPSVFLGGLYDDHNDWRKEVKKEFRDKFLFLDPYDPEWAPEENIYDELAGLILSDYRVFYKGGKGSRHEQEFLDQTKRDYKTFDDLDELKKYLKGR